MKLKKIVAALGLMLVLASPVGAQQHLEAHSVKTDTLQVTTLPANQCVTTAAGGAVTTTGSACGAGGGGSGTVGSGTGPAIAQYPAGTGTTVGSATISGDCTIAQGGAFTCTKSSGTPFGSAAFSILGNSGATLGLLNNNLTFGGADTFTQGPTMPGTNITISTIPTGSMATLQGTGPKVQAAAGAPVTNDLLKFDTNGNAIDSGISGIGSSSGGATSLCPWPLPSGVGSTGVVYYISSSIGSDSNNGLSPTNNGGGVGPWQSIAKVMTQMPSLNPGDEVLFKGGDIWTATLGFLSVQGTAAHPILFGSFGTGQPILDVTGLKYGIDACNGGACNDGGGNGNGTNAFVVINNFEVRHATNQAITFQSNGGTSSTTTAGTPDSIHDITVQNTYIHNSGPGAPASGSGAGTSQTYDNQLDVESFSQAADNTHLYCNTVQDVGGWNALEVHYDTGAVQIEGNVAGGNGHACGPHGCIDTKGDGSTFAPAQIIGNTASCGLSFGNCGTGLPGFYVENTNSPMASYVYQNNLSYDNGLGYQICNGYTTCLKGTCQTTAKYYNNDSYMPASNATYGMYLNDKCSNPNSGPLILDVRNNIIDGKPELATVVNGSSVCSPAFDYNNQGGVLGAGTLTGCFATAETHGQTNINPLYVNPVSQANDFHLQTGSPDLGAGLAGLTSNNTNIGAFGTSSSSGGGLVVNNSLTGLGTSASPLGIQAPVSTANGGTSVISPGTLASFGVCNSITEGATGRATTCASTTLGVTCSGAGTTHAQVLCNGTNWIQLGY